jgi:flagellar biosynthesis/type III secretory pathway protein FliH
VLEQVDAAKQRERERRAQAAEEERRYKARQRAQARQEARKAAKEELRAIVKAWNDAFALEGFFTELSRRATALNGGPRRLLKARIEAARELMGGQDAIERFLQWSTPAEAEGDEDDDAPAGDEEYNKD